MIFLVAVLAATVLVAVYMSSKVRYHVIRFPKVHSIGSLYVRDLGVTDESAWEKFAAARGAVVIPPGKELMLIGHGHRRLNLRCFKYMGPGDIQVLALSFPPTRDTDLVHLNNLYRLAELRLLGPLLTDIGLAHLKRLVGLRRLFLESGGFSDYGLVHLRGFTELQTLSLAYSPINGTAL